MEIQQIRGDSARERRGKNIYIIPFYMVNLFYIILDIAIIFTIIFSIKLWNII